MTAVVRSTSAGLLAFLAVLGVLCVTPADLSASFGVSGRVCVNAVVVRNSERPPIMIS
jgi:hypothetical protein